MPRNLSPVAAAEPDERVLGRTRAPARKPVRLSLECEELARQLGVPSDRLAVLAEADIKEAMRSIGTLLDRISLLEARAVHDDLTGVLRRGAGLDALRLELVRARRLGLPITIAFLDVDGLKTVNDTRGHAAGDAVLCAVAATLRRRLRATDLIIRHGGDEFVCVLPGATAEAADRVLGEVAAAILEATGGIPVSMGRSTILPEEEAADPVEVVAAADLDLYRHRADRSHHAIAG